MFYEKNNILVGNPKKKQTSRLFLCHCEPSLSASSPSKHGKVFEQLRKVGGGVTNLLTLIFLIKCLPGCMEKKTKHTKQLSLV